MESELFAKSYVITYFIWICSNQRHSKALYIKYSSFYGEVYISANFMAFIGN